MQNSKNELDELLKYAVQLYQENRAKAQELIDICWYDLDCSENKKEGNNKTDELMASLLIEVTKAYKL